MDIIDEFSFKRSPEAFRHSVIVRITDSAIDCVMCRSAQSSR
jgi:hypothetical protein